MSEARPALICIGGLDPSGGAGLIRDAWTIARLEPSLASAFVVSAWTWQGQGKPARARGRSVRRLRGELDAVLHAFDPARTWVKLGLLPDSVAGVLSQWLDQNPVAGVVLDPVLRASDGGDMGARASSLATLSQRCSLVTPNSDESEALSWSADESLSTRTNASVLFKGWGADASTASDRLLHEGEVTDFARERSACPDPRGTGCALATAIAVHCARGSSLVSACEQAVSWLDRRRVHTRLGPDGRPHLA